MVVSRNRGTVYGLGFREWISRFGVLRLRSRAEGLGSGVMGLEVVLRCRILGLDCWCNAGDLHTIIAKTI